MGGICMASPSAKTTRPPQNVSRFRARRNFSSIVRNSQGDIIANFSMISMPILLQFGSFVSCETSLVSQRPVVEIPNVLWIVHPPSGVADLAWYATTSASVPFTRKRVCINAFVTYVLPAPGSPLNIHTFDVVLVAVVNWFINALTNVFFFVVQRKFRMQYIIMHVLQMHSSVFEPFVQNIWTAQNRRQTKT